MLQPTVGELVDRRSILFWKIKAQTRDEQARQRLVDERAAIDAVLRQRIGKDAAAILAPGLWELGSINGILWKLEDEVRELPRWRVLRLAQLAKMIAEYNDRRAREIRKLSTQFGDPSENKVYGKSVPRAE